MIDENSSLHAINCFVEDKLNFLRSKSIRKHQLSIQYAIFILAVYAGGQKKIAVTTGQPFVRTPALACFL